MRIISKFHDYYDSASSFGVDMECIYKRETQRLGGHISPLPPLVGFGVGDPDDRTRYFYDFWVGFCGKLYYGCRDDDVSNPSGPRFFYGKDALDVMFSRQAIRRTLQYNYKSKVEFQKINEKPSPLCFEMRVPIFHYSISGNVKQELVLNPKLDTLKFFKVFRPCEAFSAIHQFLSNDLAKQEDPEPLADKYRVLAHGMDETSFRRDKGGPTRKMKK